MSPDAGGDHHQQIVIVRRSRGDEDEGHHGGVWKIAFADFMTAMMCFFLVMWLINAADDNVKVSLASYFNPIKLVDSTSGRQGLSDPAEKASPEPSNSDADGKGSASGGPAQESNATDLSETEERSDTHLFADPYAVLAEIAAETGTMQNISTKGDGGVQDAGPATGASGGEAYRDPFAPDFWAQNIATSEGAEEASAQTVGLVEPDLVGEEQAVSASSDSSPENAAAGQSQESLEDLPEETANEQVQEASETPAEQQQPPVSSAAASKIAEEIERELATAFEANDKLYRGLSITPTEEGVRISVTDQLDFGMFEIGSAVPRRELVLAMDKIGAVLKSQPGRISIQGHTDARPFKSETYDNWRLSTARAHSAYYMLVRGGVDERRVVEVAGFADRRLMDPEDPFAAANRRIEIILEADE